MEEKWIIYNTETKKRATTQTYTSQELAESAKSTLLTEGKEKKPQNLQVRQLLEGWVNLLLDFAFSIKVWTQKKILLNN